jgi:hypothetical protein
MQYVGFILSLNSMREREVVDVGLQGTTDEEGKPSLRM